MAKKRKKKQTSKKPTRTHLKSTKPNRLHRYPFFSERRRRLVRKLKPDDYVKLRRIFKFTINKDAREKEISHYLRKRAYLYKSPKELFI